MKKCFRAWLLWLPLKETATLRAGYQRRATVLVYLNDVAEGGSTRFDKLGIDVRPKKGQCLLFFPGTKASMPDARTLHTACEAIPGGGYSQRFFIFFPFSFVTVFVPCSRPATFDRGASKWFTRRC